MSHPITRGLLLGFLVLAPTLFSQVRPRGIYAVVNVETEINTLQKGNPSITTAQLDAGLSNFYQGLLSNPAGFRVGAATALGHPSTPSYSRRREYLLLELSGRRIHSGRGVGTRGIRLEHA